MLRVPLFQLKRKYSLSGSHYIVSAPLFIAVSQRWGNVERPFLWKAVLFLFFASCSDFTFSFATENGKLLHHQVYLFVVFFFTGLIIHDIHLCLQAPAWIDQSLIGGKCGSAAECRLNSIIENFKDREKQSSPSGGFPHCSQYWKSSEPSLAPWPLVSKHLFV